MGRTILRDDNGPLDMSSHYPSYKEPLYPIGGGATGQKEWDYDNLARLHPPVPEPSTYALGGVALAVLAVIKRKRKNHAH